MGHLRSRLAIAAGLLLVAGLVAGCQTATLLADGRVLLIAGEAAWIIDPVAGTRTPIDPPAEVRAAHTATLLPDGRVLFTGGIDADSEGQASAEILDPVAGTVTETDALPKPLAFHAAVALPDGGVLVTGIIQDADAESVVVIARYDPATGTFATLGR